MTVSPSPPLRLFVSPPRYIQGPGAIARLGDLMREFGGTPLVVSDSRVLKRVGSVLQSHAVGVAPEIRMLESEITRGAVDDLIGSLDGVRPSVSVGIGGGKVLDAAKAIALKLDLPLITVPTVASNDSPTSRAIAMYDDAHVMLAVDQLPRNPDVVLVDTEIIASAPVEFLQAGIGDAIAKKFEAEACLAGTGTTLLGMRPMLTGLAIADAAFRTIRDHGPAALDAVRQGKVTDDVEALVEAVVLMSGLGFENSGLSLAHSLTRGMVRARDAKEKPHGFHVAWALLVQLAAEDRPDAELEEMLDLYGRLGLPTSLPALGMNEVTSSEIAEIARLTMTAPHLANFAKPITHDLIVDAIARIERH